MSNRRFYFWRNRVFRARISREGGPSTVLKTRARHLKSDGIGAYIKDMASHIVKKELWSWWRDSAARSSVAEWLKRTWSDWSDD